LKNVTLTLAPTPDAFDVLDILLEGNGLANAADLDALRFPAGLRGDRGVVLNGRAPIWLYARLLHLCEGAPWVATTDPRQGAVVVRATAPDAPAVGSVLPPARVGPWLPRHPSAAPAPAPARVPTGKAVAFLGPPHSGKTVLVGAVRRALRDALPAERYQRDVFVLRACPDGEGDWFADAAADDARTLRYKNRFDDDFVRGICEHLDALRAAKPVLLVDCGGRIDRKNQAILNRCTHAVVVSSRPDAFAEWRGALRASEVTALAEVESSLDDVADVSAAGEVLRARVGPLDRGRVADVRLPPALLERLLG
jgi:CRISPR-associated protein Csx3